MGVVATVGARLHVAGLSEEQTESLMEATSYPNPQYAKLETLTRWNPRLKYKLKRIPKRVCTAVWTEDGAVILPRGSTAAVRALGNVTWVDARSAPRLPDGYVWRYGALRGYQQEAVAAAIAKEQCMVIAPPGAGKTTLGVAIIAATQCRTLILVNSRELVEQWHDRVELHMGIKPAVLSGQITTKEKQMSREPNAPIVIATVQMLFKSHNAGIDPTWYGLVLVDEAHHACSLMYTLALDNMAAKYRIGLTATQARQDQLHETLLEWYMGPVAYRVSESALLAEKHVVKPDFRTVETDFEFDWKGPDDWRALQRIIIHDPQRNSLIVWTVREESPPKTLGIVLTYRVEHVDILVDLLRRTLPAHRIVGMTSTTLASERSSFMESARNGAIDIIVATQLADEGLDLPNLDRVYLVYPAKAEGRTIQRIGRAMRPHPGKRPPVIIDFIDRNVGVLANQAKQRRAAYDLMWSR